MPARDAEQVYMGLSGAAALFYRMIWTAEIYYQIKTVGLNPLQLVLAGTVGQAVSFLAQAPTGVLADMYSRRRAVVLGFLLVGGGFLVEGALPAFGAVLVAQVVASLGATLVDGADAAWIADEAGAEQVGRIYLRAAQAGSLAGLVGVAAGTALALVRLNLPILLAGGLFAVLGVVLAVVMPEQHFRPAPRAERTARQQMAHTLRDGLRVVWRRRVLWTLLGTAALYGVFGAGFDRLWPYHLQHDLTLPALGALSPVVWFGLIEAGITVSNLVGTQAVRRWVDTARPGALGGTLCAIDAVTMAGVAAFAVAGQLALALGVFFVVTGALGPRAALEQAWMNQHLEPGVRATVFSLRGQAGALAGIAGGPILGAVALASGTRTELLLAASVLCPVLLLTLHAARRERPGAPP